MSKLTADVDVHGEGVAMLTNEDKLRAFAQELFTDWPEAAGVDGFQLQDLGEKHGLLKRKDPAPTVPCGERCACAEYYGDEGMKDGGAVCYERTDALLGNAGVKEVSDDRQHFDDARINTIVEAITAAAWHHRNDDNPRQLREAVRQITEPMLKHPEAAHGWVRVPYQHITNLLMLIDPAPTNAADGQTYLFKNPMASEVLTKLSADIRVMVDAMKGPQDG